MPLRVATLAEAVAMARVLRPELRRSRLHLRIRASGRAMATGYAGRSSAPPVLRGRVVVRDGRAVLDGTVAESWNDRVFRGAFAFLSVFMAAIGGVLLLTEGLEQPVPLVLCWGFAAVFAFFVRLQQRTRVADFEQQVQELRTQLENVLRRAPR
ncbi:MAG TPA: hypothetical protein VFR07_06820 [Mycobacteriales bacterium]|nr:hypothetical protein [Mycobacteriales bacterium]